MYTLPPLHPHSEAVHHALLACKCVLQKNKQKKEKKKNSLITYLCNTHKKGGRLKLFVKVIAAIAVKTSQSNSIQSVLQGLSIVTFSQTRMVPKAGKEKGHGDEWQEPQGIELK